MKTQGLSSIYLQRREVQPVRGGFTWGLSLASAIVATVVISLRVWSRLLNRSQRFGSDDCAAVAAWPFVVGQALSIMFSFRWGVGIHASELTDEEYTKANQLVLVVLIMYCFNIVFIRVSVSLYYKRIFSASKLFARAVWANIGINAAWLIAILFSAVFQCRNPQALWDKSVTGVHCDPPIEHQRVCSFSSVLLDLMALLLPLPMIWRLQLKASKKWEVLAIFILGYCVPVLTLGRLVSTMLTGDKLNTDPSWNVVNILYWLLLETTTAYVGVCMPAVLFLARRCHTIGFRGLYDASAVTSHRPSSRPTLESGNSVEVKKSSARHIGQALSFSEENLHKYSCGRKVSMGIVQTRSYEVTRDDGIVV